MDNASGNTVGHMSCCKRTCDSPDGMPPMHPMATWVFMLLWPWQENLPVLVRWRQTGQRCNQQSSPGDAPCDLPQLQSKFQNQGPLDLSCPNSPPCLLPRPCCGPDPVITSCVEEHPHTHTDFGLFGLSSTPSQSFWTPFQSLSSFAGWLHLGLDPTLFFVVHWAQPMHLRPKVLNHGFFSCKGKLLRYFLFHLPGNPLALGNGHC